tara:strand:- start:5787 stop:7016 length:1230 start_codon:yes stop_codon:yes gene_type:complete
MINIDNFKLNNKKLNIIKLWKNSFKNKKNIKPLIISGEKGVGKTSLANILLKDYSIIVIDYNIINSEEYIKLLLGKKDISMMFSKKEDKALLIDDIFDIKKNISEFCSYFKYLENNYNHPIIITLCNTTNKKLNNIINKCYHINISYSKTTFTNIVKNILVDNNFNFKKRELNDLIDSSNYNFNSINENIKYLKHNVNSNTYNNNNNLTKYLTTINDINIITNNLVYNDINLNIYELFIKYNIEVNIIMYNIIDNIYNLTTDINVILDIYDSILYFNYWEFIKNKLYIFNNNFDIFYSIIYPINKLKYKKINKFTIPYNKYISYSLQYINSINNYYTDTDVYYYFRKCLFNYDINKNKKDFLEILINYIQINNLNKKNINAIIRLYYYLNNQKSKSHITLINKLFKNLK